MADNSIVNSPKTTTLNPGHEPKKVGNNFPYLQAKRRQIMNRQAISLHHNTDDRMMIILIAGTGVKDNGSLVLLILLMAFFAREIKARWKIHYAKWAHGRNFANYLIMAYYWLSVVSNSNSNHKKPLYVVVGLFYGHIWKVRSFYWKRHYYLLQSLFGYFTLSFIAHGY